MVELSVDFQNTLTQAARDLRGSNRRLFMARTVQALGNGGQRWAETQLSWNRATIRKGLAELLSGSTCPDDFASRGRLRAEEHLPNLLADIRDIATGHSQTDPRFRTLRLYTRLTAEEVRRRLLTKGYLDADLPCVRTLRNKLNDLGFHLTKVAKCKPKKRSARPTPSSPA